MPFADKGSGDVESYARTILAIAVCTAGLLVFFAIVFTAYRYVFS